jgi:hypothetical protein
MRNKPPGRCASVPMTEIFVCRSEWQLWPALDCLRWRWTNDRPLYGRNRPVSLVPDSGPHISRPCSILTIPKCLIADGDVGTFNTVPRRLGSIAPVHVSLIARPSADLLRDSHEENPPRISLCYITVGCAPIGWNIAFHCLQAATAGQSNDVRSTRSAIGRPISTDRLRRD